MRSFVLLLALFALIGYFGKDQTPHFPGAFGRLYAPREWQLIVRTLGIFVFAWALLYVEISANFPSELFIYGRF